MISKIEFKSKDNRNVRVLKVGKGESVLVLHGLGLTGSNIIPLFSKYFNNYSFYFPDARGHGKTDTGNLDVSKNNIESHLADDVEEIIERLEINPKIMIAYSMGAMTAIEFLSRKRNSYIEKYLHIDFPVSYGEYEDLDGNIKCGTLDHINDEQKDLEDKLSHKFLDRKYSVFSENQKGILASVYVPYYKKLAKVSLGNFLLSAFYTNIPNFLFIKRMPDVNFIHCLWSSMIYKGCDLRMRAKNIKANTFIVAGNKQSLFNHEAVFDFKNYITRSELMMVENGAHSFIFLNPFQFQKILKNFLNDE